MTIKKLGHCCLLIETEGLRILTDPGFFSTEQNSMQDIDVVLITHEHGDHFHVDSVKEIVKRNPIVQIITNSSVGKKLDELGIAYTVVEGLENITVKNTLIEAFDGKHEEIFEDIGQVQNTGYFIDNTLFYPGDSYIHPQKSIEVLALPISGPWCRISEALRYAINLSPKKVFPVHDGLLKHEVLDSFYTNPKKILAEKGIEFFDMKEETEF
jgi:L-ascorbate metabolism protein UlaG (beta-lactamase superfamily)